MFLSIMLSLIVYSGLASAATARWWQESTATFHSQRSLVSFASCNEYTTYFEIDAVDYGGATCECSLGETSEEWVASCLYNCDLCLESGCFALSYQRYSVGVEWECLDYSAQSPSAGKLCTLYDESETELAVSIDNAYCLAAEPNPLCHTGYEYDCSNIGESVVCNENDTGDVIWQIAFDESEELCTIGTCVGGRSTTFPEPSSTYMVSILSSYQEGSAGDRFGGDGESANNASVAVSSAAEKAATTLLLGGLVWLTA